MKNIFLILISFLLYECCQSRTEITDKDTCGAIYKYTSGRFLLLDSCINKIDTISILNTHVVDKVIDVIIRNNKCILIYQNEDTIVFSSFEKIGDKWEFTTLQVLLSIYNHTGPHDIKIIDENHVYVRELATKKVKTYEINYAEKKVSVTEAID